MFFVDLYSLSHLIITPYNVLENWKANGQLRRQIAFFFQSYLISMVTNKNLNIYYCWTVPAFFNTGATQTLEKYYELEVEELLIRVFVCRTRVLSSNRKLQTYIRIYIMSTIQENEYQCAYALTKLSHRHSCLNLQLFWRQCVQCFTQRTVLRKNNIKQLCPSST